MCKMLFNADEVHQDDFFFFAMMLITVGPGQLVLKVEPVYIKLFPMSKAGPDS